MISKRPSIVDRTSSASHGFAAYVLAASLALTCPAPAADTVLPDELRTNGDDTLSALAPLLTTAKAQTVRFGSNKEKTTIAGLVVSADGYLLAPASELKSLVDIQVFLPGGSNAKPREVKRDEKLNLLLVKIEATHLQAVTWTPARSLSPAQWLCSLGESGRRLRVGVVSANRRSIPNSGAVMGVMLKGHDETDKVIISKVTPEGPAEKAGLLPKDQLLTLNGQTLESTEALRRQLGKHQPGDVVKLRYLRDGKEAGCDVRLESRSRVRMGADDFANHGTSLRTDNFPDILQHDMALRPSDIGTALYDLEGHAIGLNIARVDRVTNYALPSEIFAKQVEEWIKADRAK